MSREVPKSDYQEGSNRECLEALEGKNVRVLKFLDDINTTMVKLRITLNNTTHETEKNRRNLEAIRRGHNASFERLERGRAENHGAGPPLNPNAPWHEEVLVEDIEPSREGSMHELPIDGY